MLHAVQGESVRGTKQISKKVVKILEEPDEKIHADGRIPRCVQQAV